MKLVVLPYGENPIFGGDVFWFVEGDVPLGFVVTGVATPTEDDFDAFVHGESYTDIPSLSILSDVGTSGKISLCFAAKRDG
jgi:hypothetical protein